MQQTTDLIGVLVTPFGEILDNIKQEGALTLVFKEKYSSAVLIRFERYGYQLRMYLEAVKSDPGCNEIAKPCLVCL